VLAHLGELRVRLPHGAPGDRVRVEVHRRRGDRIEARTVEVLEAGPAAAQPRCAHFGTCGGCAYQDVRYEVQLEELRGAVEEGLAPLGGVEVEPVRPCADPYGYRNKMDFTFGARRWVEPGEPEGVDKSFALGLHVPGRFDRVLDVERCEIQFEEGNAILATLRREARGRGLPPWDPREHEGLLRHAVIRKGSATGELLLYLVTSRTAEAEVDLYLAAVLAAHPELTTVVQGVTARASAVAVGDEERILHGPGRIRERLGGRTFEISPTSFFQTNTAQAEALLALVAELVEPAGGTLYDLYCGCGSFALCLSDAFDAVFGFELVEAAVEDARRNAAAGGVERVQFVAGDLAATIGGDRAGAPPPDVVLVDPPRAGMHPEVVAALRRLAPPRLVLVSCNPRAAGRDLAPLVLDGYTVRRAIPLDLFPHTPHVECVLLLERA
jgi:23S rRNA (uracil1939-C5)-methyltransferase